MPKTIKNCFDDKLTFQKLLEAHERASKGKKNKKEVILFEMDLETNIIKILNDIKNNKFKFGKYREFIIYEPKERIIKSLPYRDRIVHQWYIEEFIKPYFFPRFIIDTFACLDNRGTHKAIIKTQLYMRKMEKKYNNYYVLKCDIQKYFYSIDKNILLSILEKYINDRKLIKFTELILGNLDEKGVPIGNYTSQFFANIYLSELDYYIKDKLKIKYYVRYMDDFILLLPNKNISKELYQQIQNFVKIKLNLKLNKKTKYFSSEFGIDFCGYKIYETHIILRQRFKKKVKKSIILWNKLSYSNKLNNNKMRMSLNSYIAHMNHCNSYNFKKRVLKKISIYL